ncbi:YhbY family RNA-binding protein [Agrilactobacillus yilanensis]|uniref:YhbY family RNA-binding protein n=1 Tax=Agrilactobacillus yilanensis TaxID=2485997 RepID=A0ABW4JC44_9LACO|nr:YhbY family RNA-binding protein [Agrilactobacillus yilanensis]
MLTGKQKRFLRSKGAVMRPLIQIGKNDLSENFLKQVTDTLEKRELVKISILQNASLTPKEAADWLVAQDVAIQIPQIIGHTLLAYRPSHKAEYQILSKAVKAL